MPRRSTGSRAAPLSCCPTRCQVPVRSTWADAGAAANNNTVKTANCQRRTLGFTMTSPITSPSRRTRRRIPFAAVRFLLEHWRDQSHGGQILRILDLRRNGEPLLTVRPLIDVPVFGQHGVLAVGNAVLPQVPRTQILRDDLQRSAGRANRRGVCDAIGGPQLQR